MREQNAQYAGIRRNTSVGIIFQIYAFFLKPRSNIANNRTLSRKLGVRFGFGN